MLRFGGALLNTQRGALSRVLGSSITHTSALGRLSSKGFHFSTPRVNAAPNPPAPKDVKSKSSGSLFQRVWGRDSNVAADTNRWMMFVPAVLTHCAIGAPYAWSVLSGPISRHFGWVTASANDWTMFKATIPLQLFFGFLGLSSAVLGKWQMRVGPRATLLTAAMCFGGGHMLVALGILTHTQPLLYLGYGILGGIGAGLAYTPPVQALMQWFPDRKGLAGGVCVAGFGLGGVVFVPAADRIMKAFQKLPEYLGSTLDTRMVDGRLLADVAGQVKEVVLATAADVGKLSTKVAEGYYTVGSGYTGVPHVLGIMGAAYLAAIVTASLMLHTPPAGYMPPGFKPVTSGAVAQGAVTVDNVMKTPQFYQLFVTALMIAAGGQALLSVAKPMMSEVFTGALPTVVNAAFASSFVMLLSVGNLGGRLAWAALSDKIGRNKTFHAFCLCVVPIYLSVPYFIQQVMTTHSPLPLYGFMGAAFLGISCMGGMWAVIPSYEADLFGTKYVTGVHGRMLVATSMAALCGPSLIVYLRSLAEKDAIVSLVSKVDPARFEALFKAPISSLDQLIAAKAVTISKLMTIVPQGTLDPSPYIYNSTMYVMAGAGAAAFCMHALVKKVPEKYFEKLPATASK